MSETTELRIEGMTCAHCEETVHEALTKVGLTPRLVDFRRGLAQVEGDVDPEAVASALEDKGYRLAGVEGQAEVEASPVREPGSDGYDLVIVGAGSAAFAAAIRAQELGALVAIVERGEIGGTCVNIGCVPSKALLAAASLYDRARHRPFRGLDIHAEGVDLAALVEDNDALVARMRKEKYIDLIDRYGFDLIRGEARLDGPGRVVVRADGDERTITARKVIVATGAGPWIPPIPGVEDLGYLTSTEALSLRELPRRLVVVGANAIGLELGQLFADLGSQVTWIEALDRIAPFEEPEISEALTAYLRDRGATVLTGARIERAERDGDERRLEVVVDGERRTVVGDQVLFATGRRARTAGLGLESVGVETDRRGHIVVDDRMATTNPDVYAAGDVTTAPQFVYVAAKQGTIAAENALRGTDRRIDYRTMPRVTFTHPQIASVGMTEAAAREAGHRVIVSVLPLEAVPRAIVERDTTGLVKLVADEDGGRILGAHMLAAGAGDVIQAAVMAIRYQATIDEIADEFHPYLTMAEALKLAAQGFTKDVSALSCCAA